MTDVLVMQLGITNKCNLHCSHCYDDSTRFRDMTMEEYKSIVMNFLETAHRWRKHAVIFLTGGEPLVHPEFTQCITFLQEKKDSGFLLSAYILTNGILVNEARINQLEKFPVVTDVQVSLDGTSAPVHEAIRGKNTYRKTMNALNMLSKSSLATHIHMVVTKKNLKEAYNLPDLGVELGVDVLTVTRLVPFGRGTAMRDLMITPLETRDLYLMLSERQDQFQEEDAGIYIARNRCDWPVLFPTGDLPREQLLKNGGHCGIGDNHFAVLEDGTVLPCRRLPKPIGNMLDQDLGEIFDHPFLWKFRRKHTLMKGKCRSCIFNNDLWKHCSGGASCISYGFYGDPFMPDPQCPYPLEEKE